MGGCSPWSASKGAGATVPAWERGFLWANRVLRRRWAPGPCPIGPGSGAIHPRCCGWRDGGVLCSYGYRRPPYGILRLLLPRRGQDLGRGPGGNPPLRRPCGRPRAAGAAAPAIWATRGVAQLPDGTLVTVYYITLGDGVTHIAATRWSPGYRGPADIPRGAAAVLQPKADPRLPPERILGEVGPRKFDYGLTQSFLPTQPRIGMVAIRVSRESARPELQHTHGLYVAIRKPSGDQWWTKTIAASRTLKADEVKTGGWNVFVFDKPVAVEPGELYVLTVYNRDYLGGPTRIRPELTGDHTWYLNTSVGQPGDYPNGSMSPDELEDLAFRVYAQPGPLPHD